MDLKLKDEVTKLLIEQPGLSIGELAKKTGNYYSYTHKLVSEMERSNY
jgi:predicted transcriptional regulator